MLPQVRLELAATVSGDGRWHTEASDPASEEGVCHGCGCDVCQWYYFRPACKAVHASQKVGKTLTGWKWSDKINVYMCESRIRRGELANGGWSVLVYFGPLALEACARPLSDILVNARPYVLRGN